MCNTLAACQQILNATTPNSKADLHSNFINTANGALAHVQARDPDAKILRSLRALAVTYTPCLIAQQLSLPMPTLLTTQSPKKAKLVLQGQGPVDSQVAALEHE
eukprot:1159306-Pelagomonas_calceolata.AAC.11